MYIDNENNEMFSKKISDDISEMLETMQATNDNSDDESNHTVAKACAQFWEPAEGNISFCGFDLMYEKVLELEYHLLCSDLKAQVGDDYDELKNSFEHFLQKLRQVILETKRKRRSVMHQLTIYDMFKPGTLPL